MATLRKLADAVYFIQLKNAEVAAKLALDIDRRLVNRTPRDTGRAARNWVASIRQPITSTLPAPANQGEAGQAIAEAAGVLKQVKPGDVIFIQNNLEYIQALNNGHSPQAPPGFVEAEIQAALASYQGR